MLNKYLVGVIQLDTQNDKKANMQQICCYIDEAVKKGAKLISLPEHMNIMNEQDAETIPGYSTDILIDKAKQHQIYIHCGSITELNPDGNRNYNTTIMINSKGEIIAKYRKLHTFDVTLPDGTVNNESAKIEPGNQIVTVETEIGILGFAICYDIRFPELFRIMALNGAQIIFTPANFTKQTGKDHWETILRTRSIENGVYIIAANQIGKKYCFEAYGNSMIINPWGTVIAKAKDTTGIIIAEIDLNYLNEVRSKIPSLNNRRNDIYRIEKI